MGRIMEKNDFSVVPFEAVADIYVVNTCSVTDNADKKCRKIIREARTRAPESKVVIVGCYAQLKPKEIAEIPGVDLVLGAAEKFNLPTHLHMLDNMEAEKAIACDINEVNEFVAAYSLGERTRSFLKIQDGCDYSCSFCTIPLARGKSRSASLDQVIENAQEIIAKGFKEIVLTGVNIGDYGKGLSNESITFLNVIQALDQLEGVERIRISSIEPNLLTDEIIDFVASSKKFVPHFHIPLQSGNDELLGKMRRRYKRQLYADRVLRIKSKMPNACIGVDVIVGFPGETDVHFKDTYQFLLDIDISYLHVFTYSERPNTLAIDMEDIVPINVRKERSRQLRSLSLKKKRQFYTQFEHTEALVLWEAEKLGLEMHGFTENYIKVKKAFDPASINQLELTKLLEIEADLVMTSTIVSESIPSASSF
ncbi:UNVERIFIED_CONTAM: hypothetical protein GTU68_009397 [Idotea baltica]|nr:hypothetical protein [Idotea baltica]